MSDTDTAEANRRAEWLHKHKAPKDWIVLTTSEVSTIREELAAVERERDEARAKVERQAERIRKLEGATNHACGTPLTRALRERDEAREQVAELSAVVKGLRAIMRQEAQAAEKKIKEAHEIAFRALIQRDEILKAMAI